MCTTPCGTCFFSFFLNVFFLPFFSGVAAPASTGFAIFSSQFSVLSSKVLSGFSFLVFLFSRNQQRVTSNVLCLSCCLLLVRDRALARALPGARVGVGTLSP